MKGSDWIKDIPKTLGAPYEEAVMAAVRAGNYVLDWVTVTYGEVSFQIMTDALRIGDRDDSVRLFGVSSRLHDRIALALGNVVTPTSKLLDMAASCPQAVHVGPHTQINGSQGMTKAAALRHHQEIEQEISRRGLRPGSLFVGYGKTYVVAPYYPPGKTCVYWWPVLGQAWSANQSGIGAGRVIQRESFVHEYGYWDYSQCAVYIGRACTIAGRCRDMREVYMGDEAWRVSVAGRPLRHYIHPMALDNSPPRAPTHVPAPVSEWRTTLTLGNVGPDVQALQTYLVGLGYSLGPYGQAKDGVDGKYGKATHNAVLAWQSARGLPKTGSFGPDDRVAMNVNRPPQIKSAPTLDPAAIPLVQAGSYGSRNSGTELKWIVIHTAEAAESSTTAEALAKWAQGKIGVSWHYAVDDDSIVQCLPIHARAYAAGKHGNEYGIHIELSGYARQTEEQWKDPFSLRMLARAALLVRHLCDTWGIPATFLTATELRAGLKGITTHAQISKAWPEETNHYDPGQAFPMTEFLRMVQA